MDSLAPGHILESYLIEKELGQGGFGITYLALDQTLNRKVAIKEYFPGDIARRQPDGAIQSTSAGKEQFEWGLKSFLSEARTLAVFSHPNIVRVLRFFEANGSAYLVMDYVQGATSGEFFTKKIASPSMLEGFFRKVLSALDEIHKSNFQHLDVKPDNILVSDADQEPVLIDFGSAKYSQSENTVALVTPNYSAVEQYSTGAEKGAWTDIYSLCATMYRLVSGDKPLDAPSRVLGDEMVPFAEQASAKLLSDGMVSAISAGLAPLPGKRPQSVKEVLDLLDSGGRSQPAISHETKGSSVEFESGQASTEHTSKEPPAEKAEWPAPPPELRAKNRPERAVAIGAVLVLVLFMAFTAGEDSSPELTSGPKLIPAPAVFQNRLGYDLEGARKSGVEDADSLSYLSRVLQFDYPASKANGWTDEQILEYLVAQSRQTGNVESPSVASSAPQPSVGSVDLTWSKLVSSRQWVDAELGARLTYIRDRSAYRLVVDSDGDFKVRSGGKLALVRQGNSAGYKLPSADMQIKAVEGEVVVKFSLEKVR